MTITTTYEYAAVTGMFTTARRVATLGNNPSIDTATQPEDVWSGAELGTLNGIDHRYIPKPQTATAMEVVSSDANDTAAGTGARTVLVTYLDASRNEKTQVIALAGTTPVAMTEAALRIQGLVVVTSGTFGGSNLGNISVRAAGGLGATYMYMRIGNGLARSSMYSVPAGYTFDLLSMVLSMNRTDTQDRWGTFSLCIQNQAGRLIKGIELSASTQVPYRHEANHAPITTQTAGTDVWLRCEAVSQNSTNVTGGLFGVARKNSALGTNL